MKMEMDRSEEFPPKDKNNKGPFVNTLVNVQVGKESSAGQRPCVFQ